MVHDIDFNELKMIVEKFAPVIIDVRDSDEYSIIHLKNSRSIPADELKFEMANFDWGQPVVFVCRTGTRSLTSALAMDAPERRILNLKNGLLEVYKAGAKDWLDIDADEEELNQYFS